jgi:hypothetical protein
MFEFEEFIGIDWSGSQDYARGSDGEFPIQIATCDSESGQLALHQPNAVHNPNWQENRWSRSTTFNWLADRLQIKHRNSKPLLIGFDFALSFPFADIGAYFPGEETSTESWRSLLALLRQLTGNDFDPNPFIAHDFYSRFFLLQGSRGAEYSPRHRITEQTEFLRNQNPANIFKLIGGDQVGRGSISGLAMIQNFRERFGTDVHVWPFDGVAPSVKAKAIFVEIWPRMLYEMVGVPASSHRYPLVFQLAMQLCRVGNVNALAPPGGENSGDALLTAAALRHFHKDASIWSAPQHLALNFFSREGWIWGAQE